MSQYEMTMGEFAELLGERHEVGRAYGFEQGFEEGLALGQQLALERLQLYAQQRAAEHSGAGAEAVATKVIRDIEQRLGATVEDIDPRQPKT